MTIEVHIRAAAENHEQREKDRSTIESTLLRVADTHHGKQINPIYASCLKVSFQRAGQADSFIAAVNRRARSLPPLTIQRFGA